MGRTPTSGCGWRGRETMTIDAPRVGPVREGAIGQFDQEVDVVVVGGGCGGVSAAVEAATAGAEVLLLERTGGVGGASAMSGGLIYLGGGTALQTACGVEDS